MVAELNNRVHALTLKKAGDWSSQPLNHDMLYELEADLNVTFRKVLLNEEATPVVKAVVTKAIEKPPVIVTHTEVSKKKSGSAKTESTRTKRASPDVFYARLGIAGVATLLLALVLLVNKSRGGAERPGRSVASVQAFNPPLSTNYKSSYTDNVLYTKNYVATEFNSRIRKEWIAQLTRSGRRDWHMQDTAIADLMGKEQQMIQDLQALRSQIRADRQDATISRMRAREAEFYKELPSLVHASQAQSRFLKVKQAFFARHSDMLKQ
jgi:hypothetical protein